MSATGGIKKNLYEQLARLGKAVGSPARLELLDLLCQGPRTVESLAHESGLSVANASQHLRVLHSARLVQAEKAGLYVTYRLADPAVCDFFQTLRALGEKRLAEVDSILRQFKEAPDSLEAIEKKTLVNRIRRGEVILLDVRPVEEYRAAHIPGAFSVPLKELSSRLSSLRRRQPIVAYCRGPYCVLAAEAVKLLQAKGFRAMRLEDGVPEWRAQGLPIAVGEAPL
jgi:rhodanese-related sulfurtransferase